MVPLRNAVHIVWADMAQVMSGDKTLADFPHLVQAADALLNELAWWATVLKSARENTVRAEAA